MLVSYKNQGGRAMTWHNSLENVVVLHDNYSIYLASKTSTGSPVHMSSVIKPWLQLSRVALGLHIAMKYGHNLPTVTLPMSVNRFVISAPKPNMKRRKNVL